MNQYRIGQVFFPGLECCEAWSVGNAGAISLDYPRAWLTATSAIMADERGVSGVLMSDVELRVDIAVPGEERMSVVRAMIKECYESIGIGAFIQN